MDEELLGYVNYKWMVSAIYREHGYIEEYCKEDKEFEQNFFCKINLDHIILILEGNLEYQMFNEQRLHTIASAMRYFIQKYEHDKDKEAQVESCYKILYLTKHPKGKSTKNFYKEEYKVRNQRSLRILSSKVKIEIDKQLILDINYLTKLIRLSDEIQAGDIEFLKSVNIFIYEYPKIIWVRGVYESLNVILLENQKYKENEELQRLNNILLDYLSQIKKNDQQIVKESQNQNIFSLLFNSDLEELLSLLKGSVFFNQINFDILCEYIMQNKQTYIFDTNIRNNARKLLHAFISENPHLHMTYSLNDLKISLNVVEDEAFRIKNIKFYHHMGKQYKLYSNEKVDVAVYKNVINTMIGNTYYYLEAIVSDGEDYDYISANPYVTNYINYLLNNYPLIKENPIYIENMEKMLEINRIWLEVHARTSIKENLEIQRKIKKLRK